MPPWLVVVGLCAVLTLVGLKAVMTLDTAARRRRTQTMETSCGSSGNNQRPLMLLVFGTAGDSRMVRTLLSGLQQAQCPRRIRVILVEAVEAFCESPTILAYKNAFGASGQYTADFADQIKVHQVRSPVSLVADAVMIAFGANGAHQGEDLIVVSAAGPQFLADWDTRATQQWSALQNAKAVMVGASVDGKTAAFTSIGSFDRNNWPQVDLRPMSRTGLSVPVTFGAWPLVVHAQSKALLLESAVAVAGISATQYGLVIGILAAQWGYPLMSAADALATSPADALTDVDKTARGAATADLQRLLQLYGRVDVLTFAPSVLMGIQADAPPVEKIIKYGSLSAVQWTTATLMQRD